MQESIGKKILLSKFSKFWIYIALILSVISLAWDLYKYFILNLLAWNKIVIDVLLICLFFILFKSIVQESASLSKFLRSKTGILISWIFIVTIAMYFFEYPYNILLSLLLILFPILHYSIRYFKGK